MFDCQQQALKNPQNLVFGKWLLPSPQKLCQSSGKVFKVDVENGGAGAVVLTFDCDLLDLHEVGTQVVSFLEMGNKL